MDLNKSGQKHQEKMQARQGWLAQIVVASCLLAFKFVQASDDEYLRTLQDSFLADNNTAAASVCLHNLEGTGISCQNITLYETVALGQLFRVSVDRNITLENNGTNEFLNTIELFVTYNKYTNYPLLTFSFDSSTANNTILSEGINSLGKIDFPTGNVFLSSVPLDVNVIHNVSLVKSPTNCSSSSATVCESGTLVGVLGVQAAGNESTVFANVAVNVDQPEAVLVNMAYTDSVVEDGGETTICSDWTGEVIFNPNTVADIKICVGGLPCIENDQPVNAESGDQNATLIDNMCFNVTT